MQHARRPLPSLYRLAVATLIKWRECLGDLGSAPIELLHDVLASCSPALLAEIEDCTLNGSGRVLSPWLWPHWRKIYVAAFGEPPAGALPALPAAAEVAAGPPGIAAANYRLAYERRQAELEQKRAESGKRLRQLREQEEQQRKLRHAVVVDPQPSRRRQRHSPGGSHQPMRSVLGGPAQQPGRAPPGDTKSRLLKKLGLGGGSTQAGASSRSRQAGPTRTFIRPPPSQPVPAAPASQRTPDQLRRQLGSGGGGNQQQQQQQRQQQQQQQKEKQQQAAPAARHAATSVSTALHQQKRSVRQEGGGKVRREQAAAQVSRLATACDLDMLFIQPPKARQQLAGGSSMVPQASLVRQVPMQETQQPPLVQRERGPLSALAQPRVRPPIQPLVECDLFAQPQHEKHERRREAAQPAEPPPRLLSKKGPAGSSGGLRAVPVQIPSLQLGQSQAAGGSGGRQTAPVSSAQLQLGQKRAAGGAGGGNKRSKPSVLPARLQEVDIFDVM